MRNIYLALAVTLVAGCSSQQATESNSQRSELKGQAGEFKHQHIEPAKLVNSWNASDEIYLEASITNKLEPGKRVAVPDFGQPGKWYVQRLTDRTYWMICNAFASTVFVGDEGVLVVDASNSVVPADMLAAIKQFTDLPVNTWSTAIRTPIM